MDPKNLQEILNESVKANQVDRKRAESFVNMVKSEGWGLYVELLNTRLQTMSETLLLPSASLDGCIASEFVKGTMSGLIIARDTPQSIIAAMQPQSADGDDDE